MNKDHRAIWCAALRLVEDVVAEVPPRVIAGLDVKALVLQRGEGCIEIKFASQGFVELELVHDFAGIRLQTSCIGDPERRVIIGRPLKLEVATGAVDAQVNTYSISSYITHALEKGVHSHRADFQYCV